MDASTPGNTQHILLMYRRPICKREKLLQIVSGCGEFTHCEVYCPDMAIMHNTPGEPRIILTGWTYTNFSMCDMMRTRVCLESYVRDRDLYRFHKITLTNTEYQRFCAWNNTQVTNHCHYNVKDLALQMLPRKLAHRVKDSKVTHPTKLYCSQAVVLALRYAAEKGNGTSNGAQTFLDKVCTALSKTEARCSTPSSVADALHGVIGAPVHLSEPNAHAMWFSRIPQEINNGFTVI
ncbi:hypothetical protein T484DRAFT_1757336 [Baffinella frigidus]|nr:hypothetical protein T484DRAFT_1757336 [Cryptophyta sp. CCMP2293]